jgi:membrane protease YdiL (CAAX protease family)
LYHAEPFTLVQAAALTGAAIATIYVTQIVLVAVGAPGLLASIAGDAVVVVGVWRYARSRGLTAADFGLRPVPVRFIAGAVLLGVSLWYLTALLVVLVDPPGDPSKLKKLVEQTPLAATLLALTVFPAVAEELVFRGVLTRALVQRVRPIGAVLISAAVFALYHVFPPQMVSTFALGIVLAWITLRSRSIVPSTIVHVLNNTVAVLLSRDEIPGVTATLQSHSLATFAVAVVLVGCGLALSAKGVT